MYDNPATAMRQCHLNQIHFSNNNNNNNNNNDDDDDDDDDDNNNNIIVNLRMIENCYVWVIPWR